MAVKVAINGFGRIGRLSLRAMLERHRDDLNVVAVTSSRLAFLPTRRKCAAT
jgi:glyceraldehyde-3-phosphate dehydrogenase/erythrose-4-phosphate dehydrogenase